MLKIIILLYIVLGVNSINFPFIQVSDLNSLNITQPHQIIHSTSNPYVKNATCLRYFTRSQYYRYLCKGDWDIPGHLICNIYRLGSGSIITPYFKLDDYIFPSMCNLTYSVYGIPLRAHLYYALIEWKFWVLILGILIIIFICSYIG